MSFSARAVGFALFLATTAAAQEVRTGVIEMLREDVGQALALRAGQRLAIRELVGAARTKVGELARRARAGDGDRVALRARATKLRKDALRAALALLDDEQKKKWAAIAAAGPERRGRRGRRNPFDRAPRELELDDLVRLDARPRGPGPTKGLWVYATQPHPVAPSGYLVLTDHVDPVALDALARLAAHRGGQLRRLADLAALARDGRARDALRGEIAADPPRYVAVAPRLASYRENTVLAIWEILSRLDEDPQLDALPGFLVASTPQSLAALVERTLAWRPPAPAARRAFTIAGIPPGLFYKAYEASGIVKKLLAAQGVPAQDLTIPASAEIAARADYPAIRGPGRFEVRKQRRRDLIEAFPAEVRAAIEQAGFLWILGHGRPGMTCAAEISAYTDIDLRDKVVFCGACFAASAPASDLFLPPRRRGVNAAAQPRFALKAIDAGSVVVAGSMGISQGLHFMLPLLEECLAGATLGEAFQRVLNTQLGQTGFAGPYVTEPVRGPPRDMPPAARRANALVTVPIGDPALRLFPRRRRL